MRPYFLFGLDLGKVADFTALAIVQRVVKGKLTIEGGEVKEIVRPVYYLRHVERLPQNVPYPDIVDLVKRVMASKPFVGCSRLVLDATGCGLPVADMFTGSSLGAPTARVVITGGVHSSLDKNTDTWHVPKGTLVSTLQVLLQNERLKVAEGIQDASKFTQELLDFQVRITDSGRDQYGAWREGQHDDMVLAVGLACWYGEHAFLPNVPLSIGCVWEGPYGNEKSVRPARNVGFGLSVASRWES